MIESICLNHTLFPAHTSPHEFINYFTWTFQRLVLSSKEILQSPVFLKIWYLVILIGEGSGTPLQYSCLENPMDGETWWATVHGVARSQTRLSNFTFTFHFHALEKEMATHSSVLAWRIPGMGEPGGLPFMGLHRVGHDSSDNSSSSYPDTCYLIIIFLKLWTCILFCFFLL